MGEDEKRSLEEFLEHQRLEGLLEQLTPKIFIWRMARGLLSSAAPRVAAAAEKRRAQALTEVAAIIKRHNEES